MDKKYRNRLHRIANGSTMPSSTDSQEAPRHAATLIAKPPNVSNTRRPTLPKMRDLARPKPRTRINTERDAVPIMPSTSGQLYVKAGHGKNYFLKIYIFPRLELKIPGKSAAVRHGRLICNRKNAPSDPSDSGSRVFGRPRGGFPHRARLNARPRPAFSRARRESVQQSRGRPGSSARARVRTAFESKPSGFSRCAPR